MPHGKIVKRVPSSESEFSGSMASAATKPVGLAPALPITLERAERNLIELTLAHHPVHVAAQLLGVHTRTLYRKIKAHGLKLA